MTKSPQSIFPASVHNHQEPCPQCNADALGDGAGDGAGVGKLQLRHGKHGSFLGCDQYPECDYIRPLHQNDGHIVKELGVLCPECGDSEQGELVLRQGRYGMFIGCNRFPECNHISSLHEEESEPDQPEIACPECNEGLLVERQSRFGKSFFACNAYPKCKFSLNSQPIKGQCQHCEYPLLSKKKASDGKSNDKKVICASRVCQKEQD